MRSDETRKGRRGGARRSSRTASPSAEPLEGRALLSGIPAHPGGAGAGLPMSLMPATPTTSPMPGMASAIQGTSLSPMAGGVHEQAQGLIGAHAVGHSRQPTGIVMKVPDFYPFYTGPHLAELNAVRASAELSPAGNFTFTGTNQGRINRAPAVYVWGVDRSGNLPAGPFQGRPNIRFDAVVVVSVNASMTPTAVVMDLANGTTTPLPGGSASIRGRTVSVTVPGSLLPSTGLAPSQFRFDFWPEDGGPPGSSSVASFLPETHTVQVGLSRRG